MKYFGNKTFLQNKGRCNLRLLVATDVFITHKGGDEGKFISVGENVSDPLTEFGINNSWRALNGLAYPMC